MCELSIFIVLFLIRFNFCAIISKFVAYGKKLEIQTRTFAH
jgi:hypothetical protein